MARPDARKPTTRRWPLGVLAIGCAALSLSCVAQPSSGCAGHPWDGSPTWENGIKVDPSRIAEVAESRLREAVEHLRASSAAEVSAQDAARYLESSHLLELIYSGKGRLYLVRALRDRRGGAFRVKSREAELHVTYGALGTPPGEIRAAALIVNLDHAPARVYATCSRGVVR